MQPQFGVLSLWGRWIVVLAIGARILLDFSGYTDIAIGSARLLGITLPENFNWPYLARNFRTSGSAGTCRSRSGSGTTFTFPLAGPPRAVRRQILNGFIAFALCGLWHGPAWHFVAWGLYHGVGLTACASYSKIPILGPLLEKQVFQREPMTAFILTQVYVLLRLASVLLPGLRCDQDDRSALWPMSEITPAPDAPRSPFFRPTTFAVGLFLGLALCSVFARVVSSRSYHPDFTRFHLEDFTGGASTTRPSRRCAPSCAPTAGPTRPLSSWGATRSLTASDSPPEQGLDRGAPEAPDGERYYVVLNFAFRARSAPTAGP